MTPLLAFAFSLASCVPMRFPSADPQALARLEGSPVNCILAERAQWKPEFLASAAQRALHPLAVVRSPGESASLPESGISGVVVEGRLPPEEMKAIRSRWPVALITARNSLTGQCDAEICGTAEALWAGIRIEQDGAAHAAPTSAPWIDTNIGFLRFAGALLSAPLWLAHQPPPGAAWPAERYLAAISDAAAGGGAWIVSLDPDLAKLWLSGDPRAEAIWKRIARHLAFFAKHRQWLRLPPAGRLAVIQDETSGALLSAGLLDMIGSRHTPVRIVPPARISPERLQGARIAINVEPSSLSDSARQGLRQFAASGGRVVSNPDDFRFPKGDGYVLSLDKLPKAELDRFEFLWRSLLATTRGENLGVRLFNVASILSSLVSDPATGRTYLLLVNYADHTAENVTMYVPGKPNAARLYTPEAPPRALESYSVEEGTAFDLEQFQSAAIIEFEP